jgi:hypothetical protein
MKRYPRAFDLVAGDSLYLNPGFCRMVRSHGAHFVVVVKNENRDLVSDARGLIPTLKPLHWRDEDTEVDCWDIPDLGTWTQYGAAVRLLRTLETREVRRQKAKEVVEETTERLWGTSVPGWKAPAQLMVRLGHGRWSIENQGFNETVNAWHADHIYRNDPNAIAALYLLLFFAYNLFHALLTRNLNKAVRAAHTMAFLADKLQAELYNAIQLRARRRARGP